MSKKKSKEVFDEARAKEAELLASSTDPFGDKGEAAMLPVARKERPKGMKVVSSGATYHNFEKQPVFEGHFTSKFLAPKDIPSNRTKKGDVIGFNFVEDGTGKEVIISNSYSIQDALEKDGFNPGTLWWIEFIEKKIVKGKPFNSFYIAIQK